MTRPNSSRTRPAGDAAFVARLEALAGESWQQGAWEGRKWGRVPNFLTHPGTYNGEGSRL